MIKNHFKLIVRNLFKRKWYALINIFGLVIGTSTFLTIVQYVRFETSYDDFHENGDYVYRTLVKRWTGEEFKGNSTVTGYALGPSLYQDYPEVESFCRIHPQYGGAVVAADVEGVRKKFYEKNMLFADSTFFEMFTFQSVAGDARTSLQKPFSIVLTNEMAKKCFGRSNAVGEEIFVNGGWAEGDYTVTAVLKDIPENSHLDFDYLLSFHDLLTQGQYTGDDGWGWYNFITYVKLTAGSDAQTLESKLGPFIEKYEGEELAQENRKHEINFQPIRDIHLTQGLSEEQAATGSATTVYAFLVVGIFILVIAWINYVNLSTARATERAREVGVKKVVGASRSQLIAQFLLESFFLNTVAVISGLLILFLTLPELGDEMGKKLSLDLTHDLTLWAIAVFMISTGSILSGIYPAFVLSSFRPVSTFRFQNAGEKGLLFRRALVVLQFGASLALIAGTLTVYKQVSYMRNQDLGFNQDQVLVVHGPRILPDDLSHTEIFNTFKTELLRHPTIQNVASSGTVPGGGFNWKTSFRKVGDQPEEAESGHVTWVDLAFINTYDLSVLAGRKWNLELTSDRRMLMVNEAALNAYGLGTPEEALEKELIVGDDTIGIIGVLQDFHWSSLKTSREAILLAPARSHSSYYSLKLDSKDLRSTMDLVEEYYARFFPGNPFDYFFIDDFFSRQYKDDIKFGELFTFFSILAIIIACMGLSGLVSITIVQRTKEIGIRKVFGASARHIMIQFLGKFIRLVFIACSVVLPMVYWGIRNWLTGYAFRIDIGWQLLIIPVLILLAIATITVCAQSIRAATRNPAYSLRTE